LRINEEYDDDGIRTTGEKFFVVPRAGPSFKEHWCRNSRYAADHVAAGAVDSAMNVRDTRRGALRDEMAYLSGGG